MHVDPLAIGLTFLGVVFGYIIRWLIVKEHTAAGFATLDFLNNIKAIDAFLKSQDTKDVIKIVREMGVNNILEVLNVNRSIDQQLQKYSERLNTISRLIDQQVFNEVNGRIHRYIEDNAKFIQRLDEAKGSKIYLANNILKTPLLERVIEERRTIFIESGSTFAYLILPLIDYVKNLHQNTGDYGDRSSPLTICTNNVIIYIILLFEEAFAPFLLPGKPTNQYAATFGDPIKTDMFSENETRKFFEHHNVTTILSTASFLDINYGPHVSSLPNWQMKRFLNKYSSDKNIKNIFVITSEKINNNVYDSKVMQDCKLIFSEAGNEPPSCKNLSTDALDRVKVTFRNFLAKDNNFIITASADKQVCAHNVNKLKGSFPDIVKHWSIDLDKGRLSVINKNMPMQ